jgi:hypothetical protein
MHETKELKMSKLTISTTVAATAVLLALSLTTPALSQDDDDHAAWHQHMMGGWMGGWMHGGRGEGRMRRFTVVDVNDDGRISDDEAAAQRELVFIAMDVDDDGELTEEEFMAVRMGPGQGRNEERMKMRQEAKRARFGPMDTDKSGKVSKAEFMAEGKARFVAADSDKDGAVTPWEFRSMHMQ